MSGASFDVVIPWQNLYGTNYPTASLKYLQFDQTSRLQDIFPFWDQYSVTGLLIEYMPFFTNNQIGAAVPGVQQMLMTSDPDDFATMYAKTDEQIVTGPGFKNLNPYRSFRKFISCKKISNQMKVGWQDNSSLVPMAPVANELTKAATMFRFKFAAAPAAAVSIGNFKVTWYVHMRG